jgi:prepilin-type N-terminal cleavage/methylation domain-containing protein
MSDKNLKNKKILSGFTLVELLVTLTIFSIMTGIVLYNQQNFNNTIFLNNLAHDIALTARQAQTYGINVKEFAEGAGFRSYGISFNKSFNKNFVLFADNPFPSTNGIFDNISFTCPNDDSECVDNFIIKNSNYIKSLCDESNCDLDSLDITFVRPNPDALIKVNGSATNHPYAKIIVASENGNTKSIIIRSTGQIYVE